MKITVIKRDVRIVMIISRKILYNENRINPEGDESQSEHVFFCSSRTSIIKSSFVLFIGHVPLRIIPFSHICQRAHKVYACASSHE